MWPQSHNWQKNRCMNNNTTQQNIPNGWKQVKLADVCDFKKGKGLSKDELSDTGKFEAIHYGQLFTKYGEKVTRIISKTDNQNNVFLSKKGDVLMPTSDVTPRGLSTASYIDKAGVILGGDILVIRPKDKDFNGLFFSYYVLAQKKAVMRFVTGTTVFHLYGSDLGKLTFNLPSESEQKRIVAVLEVWDQAIEKLKQKIEVNKEIKKGLMQELLFGKIRLHGFTDHWQDVELGEFVVIRSGDSPSGFNFVENGKYPFFKVEEMNHSSKYLSHSRFSFNSCNRSLMKKDTVVFPKRGAAIFTNKVRILSGDSYFDTNVMGLTTKNDLDSEFLYYLLLQIGLARFADTTSIAQINNKHIEPLVVSLPSKEEQEAITEILCTADKVIEILHQELSILKDQKKYLLNNLVTGTIRTPESLSIPK